MKSVYVVWRLKKKPFGRRLRSSFLGHASKSRSRHESVCILRSTAYSAQLGVRSEVKESKDGDGGLWSRGNLDLGVEMSRVNRMEPPPVLWGNRLLIQGRASLLGLTKFLEPDWGAPDYVDSVCTGMYSVLLGATYCRMVRTGT